LRHNPRRGNRHIHSQQRANLSRVKAAEANRLFYAETAETYDRTESCVADDEERQTLLTLLSRAAALLPSEPRCLDACGGSGNASLAMLERGWRPVTVDVSPSMLAIYERKARKLGHQPEMIATEIETFLAPTQSWDLIVFSSALHHLDDYQRVFGTALDALAPGGVVLTVYDPVRLGPLALKLRRADYIVHILLRKPRNAFKKLRVKSREHSVGRTAERWADEGIEAGKLIEMARRQALRVEARYYFKGRFYLTGLLFRALRTPSSFSLLVHRAGSVSNGPDD
jgi:ubiquinone/menaquinone biosynthesis C-methylase UbiE